MKKIAAAISLLVSWQAFSAPLIQPVVPSDILDGNKEASVSLQSEPAKVNVSFATSGYTIFGILYVAAAIAKMKSQSATLQNAYDQVVQSGSDKRTLNDVFDQELKKDLAEDGINLVPVAKIAQSGDADDLTYKVVGDSFKTDKLLVFDRLKVGYYAKSSTDPYAPSASILLTVFNHKAEKPLYFFPAVNAGEKQEVYSYANFDTLAKDPSQSFEGLKLSVIRLAQQLADRIGGFTKVAHASTASVVNASSNNIFSSSIKTN